MDFNRSAPYVSGSAYDIGLKKSGRFDRGINKPHKNIIGNLMKLENVCASKTSLTETEINSPRKVEVTAIKNTPDKTPAQFVPERSVRNDAISAGTIALIIPNSIAPLVFASISRCRLTGARRSLSNERLFLSNVIVTASIDVVPNNIDNDMTPGRIWRMSTAVSERI